MKYQTNGITRLPITYTRTRATALITRMIAAFLAMGWVDLQKAWCEGMGAQVGKQQCKEWAGVQAGSQECRGAAQIEMEQARMQGDQPTLQQAHAC